MLGLRVAAGLADAAVAANTESVLRAFASDLKNTATLRMIVGVRPHCPICMFYKSVIRPGLVERFGDDLTIEERPLSGRRTVVPLFAISGSPPTVMAGLTAEEHAFERVCAAVERAAARRGPAAEDELVVAGSLYQTR
jgi:hypothetical protein